jgi:hypothetical protein
MPDCARANRSGSDKLTNSDVYFQLRALRVLAGLKALPPYIPIPEGSGFTAESWTMVLMTWFGKFDNLGAAAFRFYGLRTCRGFVSLVR